MNTFEQSGCSESRSNQPFSTNDSAPQQIATKPSDVSSVSLLFLALSVLFCVSLIASNLFALKQFQWGPVAFTGALFIFPVSYILNDVVSEVWGFRRTRLLIWMAFGFNFFFVLLGALVNLIPGSRDWLVTPAGIGFPAIFGLAPRVVVASFLAFIIGSNANAFVMSRMKVASKGKYFSLRAVVSTLVGETLDSLIFFPIALAGLVPWKAMPFFVLWQVTLKTCYELVILPITIRVVRWVKKREGVDVYDKW